MSMPYDVICEYDSTRLVLELNKLDHHLWDVITITVNPFPIDGKSPIYAAFIRRKTLVETAL